VGPGSSPQAFFQNLCSYYRFEFKLVSLLKNGSKISNIGQFEKEERSFECGFHQIDIWLDVKA